MKLKIIFCLLFIFMNYFFDAKASFVENFYSEHPQFVKTIAIMMAISMGPGFFFIIWPTKKPIHLLPKLAFLVPNLFYFMPRDKEKGKTKKEICGQFAGLIPLAYILFRAYNDNLNTADAFFGGAAMLLARETIG